MALLKKWGQAVQDRVQDRPQLQTQTYLLSLCNVMQGVMLAS